MKLKVHFGLVCDDVRTEDNGKLFLIGVYGIDIRVQSFPAQLGLTVTAKIETDEPGDLCFEAEALLDETILHKGKGIITTDTGGLGMVNLRFLVNLATAGLLKFRIRKIDDDWQNVVEVPIRSIGDASNAQTPQPSQSQPAASS